MKTSEMEKLENKFILDVRRDTNLGKRLQIIRIKANWIREINAFQLLFPTKTLEIYSPGFFPFLASLIIFICSFIIL